MSEDDTKLGLGKPLNSEVLITNEEIPHHKITGCTNIIYAKEFLQFVCIKLSVNWKNKCIKIVKHFKNSRRY